MAIPVKLELSADQESYDNKLLEMIRSNFENQTVPDIASKTIPALSMTLECDVQNEDALEFLMNECSKSKTFSAKLLCGEREEEFNNVRLCQANERFEIELIKTVGSVKVYCKTELEALYLMTCVNRGGRPPRGLHQESAKKAKSAKFNGRVHQVKLEFMPSYQKYPTRVTLE